MIVNAQDGEEGCEVEAERTWRMTSQSALVVSNLGLLNCIGMIHEMFINIIFYRIISICKDGVIFQNLPMEPNFMPGCMQSLSPQVSPWTNFYTPVKLIRHCLHQISMTQIAQFLSWILFTLNQTDAIFAGRAVCPLCVGWSEGREAWPPRESLIYQIHMSGANRALCWALCCEKEKRTWLLLLRSQLCSWRKQIR